VVISGGCDRAVLYGTYDLFERVWMPMARAGRGLCASYLVSYDLTSNVSESPVLKYRAIELGGRLAIRKPLTGWSR